MPDTDALRTALYVDFDNVFMALLRWDERAAYAFGERPDAWLAWLEKEEGPRRRVLVRRCYLNPGRFIDFPMSGPVAAYRARQEKRNRILFSDFRSSFVQAGFDVVDCPPVASLKNAADMKMALDIREALDHPTRFEEFILLSGDSDFLPALTRLRAHDRRITIMAQETAKQAYLAAADTVVSLNDFANDGLGTLPIATFEVAPPRERLPSWTREPEPGRMAPPPPPPAPPPPAAPDLRQAAIAWLTRILAQAPGGVMLLTNAGDQLRRALPGIKESGYGGAGSLGRLIEEAGDPGLALHGPPHQRWLYDPARHQPGAEANGGQPSDQPDIGPEEPEPPQEPIVEQAPEREAAIPEEASAPPPAEPAAPEPAPPPPPPEPQPEPEPEPVRPMDPAEREAFILATVEKVRDMLWGKRDIKRLPLDLPSFGTAEIGFVLRAIAAHSPFGPMQFDAVTRSVAADAAAEGLHVSSREVAATIRWLLRGRVSFRDPMPPAAALQLAAALYKEVGFALDRAMSQRVTAPRPEERMSEDEWAALEAWATDGLNPG